MTPNIFAMRSSATMLDFAQELVRGGLLARVRFLLRRELEAIRREKQMSTAQRAAALRALESMIAALDLGEQKVRPG